MFSLTSRIAKSNDVRHKGGLLPEVTFYKELFTTNQKSTTSGSTVKAQEVNFMVFDDS